MSRRLVTVLAALGTAAVAAASGCGADDAAIHAGQGGGSGGATSTSTTTTSTTTTSTTTTPEGSFVALACGTDDDCGDDPDARCVRSTHDEPAFTTFFNVDDVVGGPAGGYCTKGCEIDDDCPADAVCVGDICLLECAFGEPAVSYLFDPPPADKCHGRDDLMCVPTQGGNALCMPVCGSDQECNGGRRCDLRTRVCTDAGRDGEPLAVGPCQQDDAVTPEDEDTCAGFCLAFVDEDDVTVATMCSANCSLGGELSTTQNCGGPDEGLCVWGASTSVGDSEMGDYAFCTGVCGQHDGCNYEQGMFCWSLGVPELEPSGYCLFATPCPQGTECEADEACTDTAAGPTCLQVDGNGDLLMPLGEAAGTGGAGGGVN